jgi:hypothetical protein
VLSVVLLGLAGAAGALPWQVSHERDRLEEIQRNLTVKVKAKPFKPLDDWLSTNKAVVARLQSPLNLDLSGQHNVFNPVVWKKRPDGAIVPMRTGSELGPGALKVNNIRELTLTVSFEGVTPGTAGEATKYHLTVKNETEKNPRGDSRTVTMATPHLNVFDLINVQGATNEPTALVLKLKDEFETITVTKEKPFVRVIGYAADLSYPLGKQVFNHKKIGDTIKLEDDPETYKIVAITRNEVVLSADSNKRHTILRYNANANATSTTAANTTPSAPTAK